MYRGRRPVPVASDCHPCLRGSRRRYHRWDLIPISVDRRSLHVKFARFLGDVGKLLQRGLEHQSPRYTVPGSTSIAVPDRYCSGQCSFHKVNEPQLKDPILTSKYKNTSGLRCRRVWQPFAIADHHLILKSISLHRTVGKPEFAEEDRIALAKTSWAQNPSTARAEDTCTVRVEFMSAVGAAPKPRLYRVKGSPAEHVSSPV